MRNASSAGSEARNFRCAVACTLIRQREYGKGEVAWGVGAQGRCGVWRVALGNASRSGFPLGAGTLLPLRLERLSEQGQGGTLNRFGRCGVCCRSLRLAVIFFHSLGGFEERRDYGRSFCRRFEIGAASASGRVVLGNCSPVFREDSSVACKKRATFGVPSLAPGYVGVSRAKGRWPGA